MNPCQAREWAVFLSAVVYWGGVWIQSRSIRKKIGRSPNLQPKTVKEKILWAGWMLVISGWALQPWAARQTDSPLFWFCPFFFQPIFFFLGLALVFFAYAMTIRSYRDMGASWRIGINEKEKTNLVREGIYRRVRHPIYLFQTLILAGNALIFPTLFSVFLVFLHFLLAWIKATDEEAYLLRTLGDDYRRYQNETGRFFPKLGK